MVRFSIAALCSTVALAGCAMFQQDAIIDRENTLSAAGFTVRPAATAQQQLMIATLPANRVSQRFEGNKVSYLYPDPVVCHCLYIGGQEAFGRYQQMQMQRRVASDQLQAAQLNADFAWDWSAWGGYGPAFY